MDVHVKGKRKEILALVKKLPAICQGNGEAKQAQQALLIRLGLTLLGRIKTAFVAKSHGGTDDCGLKWKPLSKSTIAYSRRHPGVLYPGSKRAPFAPSWMLTDAQRKRWWEIYRELEGAKPSGAAYHAKANQGNDYAAARAWIILKSEGAKTLIGEYGDTQVDILRDTGLLLNSLSPGVAAEGQLPPRIEGQVFRPGKNEVIVGTNLYRGVVAHEGRGHNPQRRLWAEPGKWPSTWWMDLLDQAKQGIVEITLFMLGRR